MMQVDPVTLQPLLSEEVRKEFEELALPLMRWLDRNFHPHHTVVLNSTRAEISEGTLAISNDVLVD